MLIIVEGPDGAGKSTLVRRLAVELTLQSSPSAVRVLHRGPPTAHPLVEYGEPLYAYRPGTDEHVICDRWHLGEFVYPSLLERPTHYDVAVHRHVDLFLRSRGALLVYLEPTFEETTRRIVNRHTLRSEETIDPIELKTLSHWPALVERYHTALSLSTLNHYSTNREPLIEQIIKRATLAEDAAVPLVKFTTYVGPPRPDVLFFGETRGVDGQLAVGPAPAFVPYPRTSGHYLLSHLDTAATRTVGLANACDVDDPVALWKTLGEPQLVALGQSAHCCLRSLDLKHGVAPHPQYVRRFHHHSGHRYAQCLYRAATTGEDLSKWRP